MVFSVSFFAAVFVKFATKKSKDYKRSQQSKYSLGNFVDLSDYEAERSDNELYSNGFLSGYYTVDNYSKSNGNIFYTARLSIPAERQHRESLLRKGLKRTVKGYLGSAEKH